MFAVFTWETMPFLLGGVTLGLCFGLLPGLGGLATLALLMPIIYGWEPAPALAFLMGAHAVVFTGGSVTAVLMNIPGTPANAAALIDGYPMTQKGLGGQAVGLAVTSSMVGGVIGGVVLLALVFVVRPLVLVFGLPEYFFLTLLGVSFIAVLGRDSAVKGLISGAVGIFIAMVGIHPITGIPRFTFGSLELLEGFGIVPVALGLFAVPEVLRLIISRGAIAQVGSEEVKVGLKAVLGGVRDVPRHLRLVLQSSAIGTIVGIIPGAGADTAPFVSYGIAEQTSKNAELFGHGSSEGVIAAECANNAKEGGSLLPTLAFGIPGSSAMALVLGALLLIGLKPGPMFLQDHTDVAFTLVGILIFANLIGGVILLLIGGHLARLTALRGVVLSPIVLILVVIGAYSVRGSLWDVGFAVAFGVLGWAMQAYGYNRPAFFLGFVLGGMLERYFVLSLRTYDWVFVFRPISLVILTSIILVIFSDEVRWVIASLRRKFAR